MSIEQFRATFLTPLLDGWSLGPMLEAGTQINQELIRRFGLPPILSSGVRYAREAPGQEMWILGDSLDLRGRGDCEDLSMRYAAELRQAGDGTARAIPIRVRSNLYHIVTQRGDGSIVDVSKILGM